MRNINNNNNNNNKNGKDDNDNMKVDRKKLEEDSHQEFINIVEATTIEIKKEFEKFSGPTKLIMNYEKTMNSLPSLLNISDQLVEKWNLKTFLEDPQIYIDQFKIKTHRIDSNISVDYNVEELKTIHHLNIYLLRHISQLTTDIGILFSFLEICSSNYGENSHLKHIVEGFLNGLSRTVKKYSHLYQVISHFDTRDMDPHKVQKYPMIDDLKIHSETHLYTGTYSSVISAKSFRDLTYSFYNFLLINKDNWKRIFDSFPNSQ